MIAAGMSVEQNEYHIVAFDPGGTTGWAHLVLDYRGFSRPNAKALRWLKWWDCGEYTGPENDHIREAERLIWSARFGDMPFNSTTDVVASAISRADFLSEDFELMQTKGGNNLLTPVRINAKLDWVCAQWGLKLNLQRRSMRTGVTADRLTAFGFPPPSAQRWTTSGKGKDAFAAMQHAVTWLRRVKAESRTNPWKLSEGGKANARWDCACSAGGRCEFRHRN